MPDKQIILSNCMASSGYQGDTVTNISAARLVDLLESYARTGYGDLKRDCKDLLNSMELFRWRISAGIHAGGLGGGGRNADPRFHITLSINNHSYHIRFGQSNTGLRLVEIT